jgi:uncharacterized protein (DUF1015 family)
VSAIKPFRGLRPVPDKASAVASPPYDVLSSEEARQMAKDNPISFLRVVKPEIDLDPGIDVHSDEVYEKGRANLTELMDKGVMVRDDVPCLYLYEQRMEIAGEQHVQVGLVTGVSVDEYQQGLIKKHEFTRPDKEADRTRHIDTLNAQAGPVFLTYRADPRIDGIIERLCSAQPVYDFVASDVIGHRFWVVDAPSDVQALVEAFDDVPHLYVADGHHRSASASNVREKRKARHES